MAVYDATASSARDKLEELHQLCTSDIVTLNISEEVVRNPRLRKEPTMMYPYKASLLVRRGTADLEGRTDLEGERFDESIVKFPLWPETEPPDIPALQ